jgi:CspA family cold shock protein
MKGIVRWFSPAKGFGFIYSKEHGGDIFVHTSGIKAEDGGLKILHAEDRVEFEPVKEVKGFAAKNVTVVKKGTQNGNFQNK